LGIPRGDARLVNLSTSLRVAVRADMQGRRLVDYHTVQAKEIMSAEGKPRSVGNTIVSHRGYLQDASFLVLLTSSDDRLLSNCAAALQRPVWPPYLGRKSCVPSLPLYVRESDVYASLKEAIENESLSKRAQEYYKRQKSQEPLCSVWIEIAVERAMDNIDRLSRQDRLAAVMEKSRRFAWGSYQESRVLIKGARN
jgi:CRISPR-associated protein Cas5/CasD subtype I-E